MSGTDLIFDVTTRDFERDVIEASHQQAILVDLWADWCPPCLVIAPLLDKIVQDSPIPIKVAKVEVDEGDDMKIAGRYKARGFPTVMLFHCGEEKARFSGAKSLSFIMEFIQTGLD